MKKYTYILGGILAFVIIASIGIQQGWVLWPTDSERPSDAANTSPPEFATVARVLDPTTIELDTGHRVRYIGVRAPDIFATVQCFGKEALLANESIIGKRVRLEEEPLLLRSNDGSWTRYVWIEDERAAQETPAVPAADPEVTESQTLEQPVEPAGNEANADAAMPAPDLTSLAQSARDALPGNALEDNADNLDIEATVSPEPAPTPKEILINERILEGGFGFPVVSPEMVYGERMLSAAKFASATGKGLWGRCEISEEGGLHTQEVTQCVIKGKVSVDGDKLYRAPGCPAYVQTVPIQADGGQWFCAEDIAQDAGFNKAPDCG